ncbi:MAG: DVUA0089 family protein [Bacteroidales bacterium]|nr:DVUA0089 family protein [Bacteroidales bacterium]
MKTKVYTRALMVMIVMLSSGLGWSADIHVPADYGTIQAAINAANPGDNIIVAAGNYTEQLTINKSLDLIGAGEATTTITAPAVRAGSVTEGATIHDYLLAAYASSGTIDVRIEGFSFDINGQNKTGGTAQLDGVFFRDVDDAGGTVAGLFSCTIHNFAAAPEYEGFGLVVYGSSDLTINDIDIHDYTRDGILIRGTSIATVSNNTVTGNATCLNGISMLDGATGTISGNSVSGNIRSIGWAAVGIIVWNSDDVVINGNNIVDDCWNGIYCQDASNITVDGNTLTNIHDAAVVLHNTDGSTVTGNTISDFKTIANAGININTGSTGNTIGALGNGNSITMLTAGTGNLRCVNIANTTGSGSNTIQYNTFNGGIFTLRQDGGITGTTTFAHNTVGDVTSPATAGLYFDSGILDIKSNTMTFAGTVNQGIFMNNACATGSVIGGNAIADGNTMTFTLPLSLNPNPMPYAIQIGGADEVKNFTVKNNVIVGSKRAVQVDGPKPTSGGTLTVSDNTISNADFGAIVSYDKRNLVISGNELTNNARPVEFFNAMDVDITGNTINGSTYDGINLGGFTGVVNVSDNVIHDIGAGNHGIHARASGTGLNITGNELYNISGRGIQINGTADGANIDGNEIHDITGFAGICIDGGATGVKINNNDIHDNEQGVVSNAPTAEFSGNFIYNNRWGIDVNVAGETLTLFNNSISDNNTNPADSYGLGVWAGTAVANCNWWGTLGFNADNVISVSGGALTLDTWLENGTDDQPGTVGFQPEATNDCGSGICSSPPHYNFTLNPTGSWATHSETLIEDACAVYKLITIPGKEYTFKTGCETGGTDLATADFDTKLDLYDASGDLITSNDDGCDSYRSILTWTATETSAYVKVYGFNHTFGDFTASFIYISPAGGGCKVAPDFDGLIADINDSWQTAPQVHVDAEKCFVYMITLPVADTYTFKTGCASGFAGDNADASFDTFFELYDADGEFINSNDDQCEEGRSKLNYTSTAVDEIVYLKIRGYNILSTGNFTLAYIRGTGPVICQTVAQAIADAGITELDAPDDDWNTDFGGTINPGACKFYKVALTEDETVTFKTGCGDGASTSAGFDTFLELWNAAGNYMTANDDGCEGGSSKIIYEVPATGTYYLKIRGYNDESTGTYTLAYSYGYETVICKSIDQVIATSEPDYGPITISTVGSGVWATTPAAPVRTIAAGACDVYAFNLVAGKTYTFKTGCSTGAPNDEATATFDTYLALFNTTGAFIDSDDDQCELGRSKLIYKPAVNGIYYLKVSGYNDQSTGTYRLAYRYGSDINCTTPGPDSYDETLDQASTSWQTTDEVNIVPEACWVYKVPYIKQGVEFTFKTGCATGGTDLATANFDTFLDLFDDEGNFIDSNDDQCELGRSELIWTANYGTGLETDVAYIKVRAYSVLGLGKYRMAYKYVGSKEVLASTGNQSAESSVNVFPNPADQLFTIDSKAPVTFTRITISELTGRMLHTWAMDTPASKYQINSSEFSAGIYVLTIETSEGWIRKKISIVR